MKKPEPSDKAAITRDRTAKWRELDPAFKEFCALSDHEKVCEITIGPDGKYGIPHLKDGKLAKVSNEARTAFATFLREVADGIDVKDQTKTAAA